LIMPKSFDWAKSTLYNDIRNKSDSNDFFILRAAV